MTQREIKIDLYQHLANVLRNEALNCNLVTGSDLAKAMREQERLSKELERRAERLARNTQALPEGGAQLH